MKKFILSMITCTALCALPAAGLYAASVDAEAADTFEKITAEYIKKNPQAGMKKGLCVLKFSEDSAMAKESGLGTTVRDIMSGTVSQSQVFFLVDRETISERMKEMELSMTGMVDEKSLIQAGRQTGVAVFLTGSVSEVEDQFQVTVRLVDSETGTVASQGSFRVPRRQMVRKHEEIAFGYIAQHGIGINWQSSYLVHPRTMGGVTLLNDVFVSYRPQLWLNLKLGVTYLYLEMWDDSKVNAGDVYHNYTNTAVVGYDAALKTGYSNGLMEVTSPYIGAEFNWLVSPEFTIGLGVSATFFMPNTLKFEQTFTGNPRRVSFDPVTPDPNYDVYNTMVLTQTFDPAIMFRVEIKPQYFITPRAAIGLYIAATYTKPLSVERADFRDGTAIYPNDPEGDSDPGDMHLGFNAKQFGLDKDGDVEEDLALLGCAVGLSASFYF